MYHPINRPDCEQQLQKLNDLARLTIAFALENDADIGQNYHGNVPPQTNLATRLGDNFLAQYGGLTFLAGVWARFVEYFATHGKRKAGEWLWRKPVVIAEPVVRLLVIPLAKKQGVLTAFDADRNLENRFVEGSFRYSIIPASSTTALEYVKAILQSFYVDILAKGVPADVLDELDDLDRQTVLRAYLNANRGLKVCPGCDGSPPSVADGIIHEDIDHIFPKSKYPFLAIHHINLTPFCKHCNQTYKKDKDALDAPGVTSLMDIYHPYLCPARGETTVIVERDPADGEPHLHLRANPTDPQHIARLNSLNHLLNLETRWEGDLREGRLSEKLIEAFRYISWEDRSSGVQPDTPWFQRKIFGIIDEMRRSAGKTVGSVSALAYASFVATDAQAASEWLDKVRDTLF